MSSRYCLGTIPKEPYHTKQPAHLIVRELNETINSLFVCSL